MKKVLICLFLITTMLLTAIIIFVIWTTDYHWFTLLMMSVYLIVSTLVFQVVFLGAMLDRDSI